MTGQHCRSVAVSSSTLVILITYPKKNQAPPRRNRTATSRKVHGLLRLEAYSAIEVQAYHQIGSSGQD